MKRPSCEVRMTNYRTLAPNLKCEVYRIHLFTISYLLEVKSQLLHLDGFSLQRARQNLKFVSKVYKLL